MPPEGYQSNSQIVGAGKMAETPRTRSLWEIINNFIILAQDRRHEIPDEGQTQTHLTGKQTKPRWYQIQSHMGLSLNFWN